MVEVWILAKAATRRDELARSITAGETIRVAGAAATFPFLRSLMTETAADAAVIDWDPSAEPATIRDWLFEFLEIVPVVLLTSEPDPAVFNRMVRVKAGGILRHEAPREQIVQAIGAVAGGLMVFDGVLMTQRHDTDPPFEPLTPRETEVLRSLAEGSGNREIAAHLNVSEHTIKFHIRSILGKLGASSRTEAVSRGLRSGLIEL